MNIGILVGGIYLAVGLWFGIMNLVRSQNEHLLMRIIQVPIYMVLWFKYYI
jgi:hypothetical protein